MMHYDWHRFIDGRSVLWQTLQLIAQMFNNIASSGIFNSSLMRNADDCSYNLIYKEFSLKILSKSYITVHP
jgi:hypothetical protein